MCPQGSDANGRRRGGWGRRRPGGSSETAPPLREQAPAIAALFAERVASLREPNPVNEDGHETD